MVQSDALSRREDHIPEEDNDNEDRTLLPDTVFLQVIDANLRTQIATSVIKDEIVKDTVQVLKTQGPFPMKSSLQDWKVDNDGLIFFRNKCYVPQDQELRKNITDKYHKSPSAGHPGFFRTLELI